MRDNKRNSKRNLAIGLGFVAAAGIGGSAFAAAITTESTNAGVGVSTVAGYNATNIAFVSDAAATNTSTAITAVKFNLYVGTGTGTVVPTTGHTVLARAGSGNWVGCDAPAAAGLVTCTGSFGNIAAGTPASIEIVAYRS